MLSAQFRLLSWPTEAGKRQKAESSGQKAISKWQMANCKRVNKLKSEGAMRMATGNKLHFDCMASLVHDLEFWLLNKSAPNAFSGCPRRPKSPRARERILAKDAPNWDGWLAATAVLASTSIYSTHCKTKWAKKAARGKNRTAEMNFK